MDMAEHPSFSSPLIPPGEPVEGESYRADGWAYIDPPGLFSPEAWDALLGHFGEGEVVILAGTSGFMADGRPFKRGQLLVSPKGMEAVARFVAENTPPTTPGTDS